MRNPCKHGDAKIIKRDTMLDRTRVEWCRDCGATRFSAVYPQGGWAGVLGKQVKPLIDPGPWRSPKLAIQGVA